MSIQTELNSIHTNLYSRQIGAIGKTAMSKLMNIHILIIGCDTIGQECLKCLCLMGIGRISIYDPTLFNLKHKKRLINSNNVGDTFKTLADYAIAFANELNPSVKTFNYNTLTPTDFDNNDNPFNCVVYTNEKLLSIKSIETICRNNEIKLIMGFNNSFFGYIFCDFISHNIYDADGETSIDTFLEKWNIIGTTYQIEMKIEKLFRNLITNTVSLINEHKIEYILPVVSSNLNKIVIECSNENYDNVIEFLQTSTNIRIIEKKNSQSIQHKSFSDKIKDNQYKYIDLYSSFGVNDNLYNEYINYLLNPKKLTQYFDRIPMDSKFFLLGSIIGALIAQEVLKITGKYTPLSQEILFSFEELRGIDISTSAGKGANYDLLCNIDKSVLNSIKNKNLFMVGCGALGCELSKNIAMMGFCQLKSSGLYITDMDTIEVSNLSRQFMFRNENVGKLKSDVLKDRINTYFPKVNIKSFSNEVGISTENVFDNNFWNKQDLIINALDNIEARKYVDSKCVLHLKPLFESGTLGTKCNTQIIIPHNTATYSEIKDVEEKSIPMCTIRNFPNKIEHCIEWSLELFDKVFCVAIQQFNDYYNNPTDWLKNIDISFPNKSIQKDLMDIILIYCDLCSDNSLKSFMEFTKTFYRMFYEYPIKDVLDSFPDDLTDENGNMFWTGNKVKPIEPNFKLVSISWIKSLYDFINDKICSIETWDETTILEYINSITFTQYKSKKLSINSKKEVNEINDTYDEDILKTKNKLLFRYKVKLASKKKNSILTKIEPLKYDKDDDIMVDIMTHIANHRAELYKIEPADKMDIKILSGRIIPALSTTTTVVAAFVILEIFKYLSNKKNVDLNMNLAINEYLIFDCNKPLVYYDGMYSETYAMKVSTKPEQFSTWDRINIDSENDSCFTIDSLISILTNDHHIYPEMITFGKKIIYKNTDSENELKKLKLFDIIKDDGNKVKSLKRKSLKGKAIFDMVVYDKNDIPVITPPIIYNYKF